MAGYGELPYGSGKYKYDDSEATTIPTEGLALASFSPTAALLLSTYNGSLCFVDMLCNDDYVDNFT